MNKLLLIYEDYTELNTLQFTLKKVGFDCVGISTEFSTAEQVLSFNPDIVIACGKGPKVSTASVGRRLKEMTRWNGKSVLIFPPGVTPRPEDLIKIRMDMVLEAPVPNVRLIQVLAKLTNQDDQILLEKLIKTVAHEEAQKEAHLTSVQRKGSEERVFIGGQSEDKDSDIHTGGKKRDSQNRIDVGGGSQDGFGGQRISGPSERADRPVTARGGEDADETALPVERQEVNWSEVENQLFGDVSAAGESAAKAPQFPLNPEGAILKQSPETDGIPAVDLPPLVAVDAQAELARAQEALAEKMKKYRSLTEKLELMPGSTMKRTDLRKAQNELLKDWDPEQLKEQDELRRKFTKALFEKK